MSQVLKILHDIRPECDFSKSSDFLEEGLLDSMDLITLVSDLDRTFAISIEGVDIVPENFSNLESIRVLLANYGVSVE